MKESDNMDQNEEIEDYFDVTEKHRRIVREIMVRKDGTAQVYLNTGAKFMANSPKDADRAIVNELKVRPPCRNCADRAPSCHDSCELFANYRKCVDAENEARRNVLQMNEFAKHTFFGKPRKERY